MNVQDFDSFAASYDPPVTGEALRDAGIASVVGNTPTPYKLAFSDAYERRLALREPFTSEEVVDICGFPPNHVNSIGGLMAGLVRRDLRAKRIRYLGHVKTQHPSGHATKISQYVAT